MLILLQWRDVVGRSSLGLLRWMMLGLCLWMGVAMGAAHGLAAPADDHAQMTFIIQTAGTHEPIVGATVQSDGALSGAATNGDGRCTLRFKQGVGQVKIEVSSVGYKRLVRTVTVRNGQTLTLLLQEDAKMLDNVVVTAQKRHTDVLQQPATTDAEA